MGLLPITKVVGDKALQHNGLPIVVSGAHCFRGDVVAELTQVFNRIELCLRTEHDYRQLLMDQTRYLSRRRNVGLMFPVGDCGIWCREAVLRSCCCMALLLRRFLFALSPQISRANFAFTCQICA